MKILIYVIEGCPFCAKALEILTEYSFNTQIKIVDAKDKESFKRKHKVNTFPQIFYIDNNNKIYKIGGCTELQDLVSIVLKINKGEINMKIINDIIKMMHQKKRG